MKKFLTILTLISAILALIISVLPVFNLAYIPAVLALALGITALVIQKNKPGKKTINLAFLLTVIALGFTVYKSIFTTSKVGNIKELEKKAEQSVEESLETLEGIDVNEDVFADENTQESFGDTDETTPIIEPDNPKEPEEEIQIQLPEEEQAPEPF